MSVKTVARCIPTTGGERMRRIHEQNCKKKDLHGCTMCPNHVIGIVPKKEDPEHADVRHFCDEKRESELVPWQSEE